MLAFLLYAWRIEPNMLIVKTVDIQNSLMTKPCTVLFVADLHVPISEQLEQRICRVLQEKKPDILLIGGDFASRCDSAAYVMEKLRFYSRYCREIMVPGNTDTGWVQKCVPCSAQGIFDSSGKFPLIILRNRTYWLPEFNMTVFGQDDPVTDHDDTAFFESTAKSHYDVLLTHSTHKLTENQRQRFHLILGGHTHGGQIIFLRPFVHFFDHMVDAKHVCGTFSIPQGHMLVTSGIGVSFLPFRCGVPPEAYIITLHR
jgi:predicted MPP superfamily phosphohydrolase